MKEIRAIVRPARLERLREALRAIPGSPGVVILRAEGFTAPASLEKRSIRDELTGFVDKLMVCVLCESNMVETVRETIIDACQTGKTGDGLVWVIDIAQVHRIRDRQRLDKA